ncbi:MAG: hypothetical protein JWL77_433 [Chthonomonadaceae bacterium]|nr:hypothetical protein [Chthonomonadaceae bacterium]
MSDEPHYSIADHHRAEAVISAIVDAFGEVPFSFFDSVAGKSAQIQWLQQVLDENGALTVPVPFDMGNGSPVFLWSMDFTGLSVEQAHYVLPRLLIDTVRRWPEDEAVEGDATDIVLLLDINGNLSEEERALIGTASQRAWLRAYDRVRPSLAEFKARPFHGLSRSQIGAIILWIEFVQTWPDMEYHAESLQSALDYWTACLSRSGPEHKIKKKHKVKKRR